MNNILIGADPELFVKDGNNFVSGFDLIPGTKYAPHKVRDGAVQVDGMALEFNIDPAADKQQFVHNINSVLGQLQAMIPNHMSVAVTPVANFDPEYMKRQPAAAKVLGCDPDYNAYTGQQNPRPKQHPTMRTAAGHIHVGWGENMEGDQQHMEECCMLARQLDYFLGIPSVLLDPDNKRREMYGQAGAFRPKPYGMEYRVLSNFWLTKPEYIKWVYEATQSAFYQLVEKELDLFIKHATGAKTIIGNNDKLYAYDYCYHYRNLFCLDPSWIRRYR